MKRKSIRNLNRMAIETGGKTVDQAEQMDLAASKAQVELDNLDFEMVAPVAEWWAKWYMTAGHKRLGRVLLEYRKEPEPGGK